MKKLPAMFAVISAAIVFAPSAVHAKATVAASTITCKDGSTSSAKTARGACSHHGGVAAATSTMTTMTPGPNKAPMTTHTTVTTIGARAGATAKCKDGTWSMSKTHSGTCSHHGGVASWLK